MTVFEAARQVDCIQAAERLGLQLKRSDSRRFTRCLFHVENTPSMCLYPDGGGFYCQYDWFKAAATHTLMHGRSAGNGSLMRTVYVGLYCNDETEVVQGGAIKIPDRNPLEKGREILSYRFAKTVPIKQD